MFGIMRKSCTQCGAPVDWIKLEDLDTELRADAKRAEAFMGEPISSVWRCARAACGEVGFFGAVHSGF
jgi:hypothetical protein